MLKIKQYIKAESLAQAYELNQKRNNRIIGGMLWLKMSNAQVQTAIDLSGLGLDRIEETEEECRIGCMVTLRELEMNQSLERLSGGIVRESVKNIVGVQFRNLATVGGSLFGRFGFSDVLTCFLAMDTYVELYQGGIIPLEEFAERKRDNDILVKVIVKKTPGKYVYLSHRNTKTDFPVLTAAVSCVYKNGGQEPCKQRNHKSADFECKDKQKMGYDIKVVVGARPAKAICLRVSEEWSDKLENRVCQTAEIEKLARELAEQVQTGTNMRAGAAYRSHLAEVLIKRGLLKIYGDIQGIGGDRHAD